MPIVDTGAPPEFPVAITEDAATRIFRVLVAFANADHDQLKAFVHQMSTTSLGLGQTQWRIKAGYYGPTCFFICDNEWFVTNHRDDISPRTRQQVDTTNLELAKLRDTILTEQYP